MNFTNAIQKIKKDRDEGKTFEIMGFNFKLRSFKGLHMKKVLLKNKISNFQEILEDKDDKMMKIIIENIVLDWDGIETDEGENVPFSQKEAVEILLDKDKKGNYKHEIFLSEMFQICVMFEDKNFNTVYKASKNL